jgi:hypothetical protein
MKHLIDTTVSKFFSRKLLVWLSTTGLLLAGSLDGEQWVAISLVYIGTQAAADIAAKWKNS